MKGINIIEIMNAVKSVLSHRKVYRYVITADIQFFNPRAGAVYPGEQPYCWGDKRELQLVVYSFNKINRGTLDKLSAHYGGMLLPGCEKEVTEKLIKDHPEFFTIDIEEISNKISKDIYL